MIENARTRLDEIASLRRRGGWSRALERCDLLYRICWRNGDVSTLSEVLLAHAHTLREMGDWESASDAYELVVTIARNHSNHVLESRAFNGHAIVLQQQGAIDLALEKYQTAMLLADGRDSLAMADTQLNIGALMAVQGDLSGARANYNHAIGNYRLAGNQRGLIGSLNNLGMLHLQTGRLSEAEACFSEALTTIEDNVDQIIEATVRLNLAELCVSKMAVDDAWAHCTIAHNIFSTAGDASGIAESHKQFALIHRDRGELHLAIAHLEKSLSIAKAASLPLEEAEAGRILAQLLRRLGRNRDCLTVLYRTRRLFEQLRAQRLQDEVEQRLRALQHEFLLFVRQWSDSIDAKDPYTRGHCQRVASYGRMMASAVGFDEDSLVWFEMGALLHDVGKTAIPARILTKPKRLLPAERTLVEQHPVLGETLLSDVEFPWDIRPMVRSHHERWDGSGYPDGLAGTDIPLSARIIHIVDVFDALTSDRSYRRRLAPEAAFDAMRVDISSFDPELFRLFESLWKAENDSTPKARSEVTGCRG